MNPPYLQVLAQKQIMRPILLLIILLSPVRNKTKQKKASQIIKSGERTRETSHINIVHNNGLSLYNKFHDLYNHVSSASSYVIVIPETWMHTKINDAELSLANYMIIRKNRYDG